MVNPLFLVFHHHFCWVKSRWSYHLSAAQLVISKVSSPQPAEPEPLAEAMTDALQNALGGAPSAAALGNVWPCLGGGDMGWQRKFMINMDISSLSSMELARFDLIGHNWSWLTIRRELRSHGYSYLVIFPFKNGESYSRYWEFHNQITVLEIIHRGLTYRWSYQNHLGG
jgi:hypothetical protein